MRSYGGRLSRFEFLQIPLILRNLGFTFMFVVSEQQPCRFACSCSSTLRIRSLVRGGPPAAAAAKQWPRWKDRTGSP